MFKKRLIKKEPTTIKPASHGSSMQPFIDWINTYSDLTPSNIFEIGANMAQDAIYLRDGFSIEDKNVYVFEPHPELIAYIRNSFSINAFDTAVSNVSDKLKMNMIKLSQNDNSGISSLRNHKDVPDTDFVSKEVQVIRMEDFIKQHKVKTIDFLKLDIEGCNYEALEGFGDSLDIVQSMHVEAEHHEHWEGQKLWEDLRRLLEPKYEMVYFERHFTQSDSFWIKKELIRKLPK